MDKTHIQNAHSPIVDAEAAYESAEERANQVRSADYGSFGHVAQGTTHDTWEVEYETEQQLPFLLITQTI